jgi:hypothetical protein
MSTSASAFKEAVLDQLLGLLWRQWAGIGVSGYSAAEESKVVDPEALLLLTLTVARHDARLFDGTLDWLLVNGDFVNVQRLQNLAKQASAPAQASLGAIAEILGRKTSVALKWKKLAATYFLPEEVPLFFMADGRPMPASGECDEVFRKHGLLRPPFQKRDVARPFPQEGMVALLLRLRALLGVSIRCEILCLLGSRDEIHPSLIARLIGLAPRTIQNLLAEMVRSGAVQVRTRAREKIYALAPGYLDALLRPQGRTPWLNSVPLFRALGILWLGLSDPSQEHLNPLLLSSEWRRLAREIGPLLGDAGLGQPLRDDSSFVGEAYYECFVEDTLKFLRRF